jgi:hypothetical protein
MYIDRADTGPGWDERHDLGQLIGRNAEIDTDVDVEPGDVLDIELYVQFQGFSKRIRYTTGRRSEPGDSGPRVIASQNGFRCGVTNGSERPLDVSDLTRSADHLISLSCWEDWTDFDYNDFALCVDYTPGTVPTETPTVTASPTVTATLTTTPTVTASPSPSPTSTSSPSATPSPTPSPTATASLTPTPLPQPLYLPVALLERCVPTELHTDVVLVLDMSTSMSRPTSSGRSKHAAALAAAASFVGQLDLRPGEPGAGDRVGVVGFNNAAWTATGLTQSETDALAALASLPRGIAEGTRLDLAFEEGARVLAATSRDSAVTAALVVLTDGLPNRVPTPVGGGPQEDTVLGAARAAREAGSRVFTIGLGTSDDVLHELLRQCASDPDDYFYAPDGEDLAAIYDQIAGVLDTCP